MLYLCKPEILYILYIRNFCTLCICILKLGIYMSRFFLVLISYVHVCIYRSQEKQLGSQPLQNQLVHRNLHPLREGQMVWTLLRHINSPHPNHRFSPSPLWKQWPLSFEMPGLLRSHLLRCSRLIISTQVSIRLNSLLCT